MARCLGKKKFYTHISKKTISQWITSFETSGEALAFTGNNGPDFQNNIYLHISSIQKINENGTLNNATKYKITTANLIPMCIYFSVRHAIEATWINDRDQFLYPNDKWQRDITFQHDCLAFALFHGQNRISAKAGINHFIPFSEVEIGAKEAFASDFMYRFIHGKIKLDSTLESNKPKKPKQSSIVADDFYAKDLSLIPTLPLAFSPEALAIFNAGKALYSYYHNIASDSNSQQSRQNRENPYNVNASLYDIKAFFQGFSNGKMNPPQKAQDEVYKDLLAALRTSLNIMAQKLESSIYKYGFLMK